MKPFQEIHEIPAQRLQSILHYEDMFLLIDSDNSYSWLNSSHSLRDYVVITILEKGSITLLINGITRLRIDQPGIIYHFPEQVFEVQEISEDQHSKNILFSREFARQLNITNSIDLGATLAKQLFIPMQHEALQSMLQYYDMCKRLLKQTDNPNRLEALRHLTIAYFLNYNYYFHQHQPTITTSREEEITMRFLSLLNTHFKREHQVNFYAKQLCLTPKYMSQCVKQATNYSAKDCINHHIISYAQQMLRSPDVSVSELSNDLSFTELTAFGKFFKLHTGLSPKDWRTAINSKQ